MLIICAGNDRAAAKQYILINLINEYVFEYISILKWPETSMFTGHNHLLNNDQKREIKHSIGL